VIVFGANVIYSDFIKQPHLVLEIRPRDLAVAVSLINTGITTAHNVRETLSSNATQITNHIFESVPDEQINFTNLDRPQGLVLNASRLTPGDKFTTDEDILRARTTR
jgi:hypothetical protein